MLPFEIHAAEPQDLLEIQIQENMKDIAYSVRSKSKDQEYTNKSTGMCRTS